ncbi:type III secretion system protein PrgE, partial [Enterococcus faecalis]|uniref:type III secretion system protein PrgE n=2 Tax=Bacillota TaxID=1239 RepID=UPI001BDF767A|nr:type III secretion system protein PrgE [Enterococcus faecalis]
THAAVIEKVQKKRSQKGNDMFLLSLLGKSNEKGVYFLTFGNDYTEDNLRYILASIQDNGVEIPDVDFGYNRETFEFLKGKDVYIQVEEQEYKGKVKHAVTNFLTQDEFEESEEMEFSENNTEEDW